MSTRVTQNSFDVIVIGGGHNGLTAAAYLARAGLKVLVVERRPALGGAAATEPLFNGFQVDTGASDAGMFLPEILRDLRLEEHGLRWLESPALAVSLLPEGDRLTLWRDPVRTQAEIARFSASDSRRYPEYLAWLETARRILRPVLRLTPPSLPEARYDEVVPWLAPGLNARRQGGRRLVDLLRALPASAQDFLDEWFENQALKGALAGLGLRGARLGPKAPGTAFLLLYHALNAAPGEPTASRFVQGGMGALSAALAASARSYGAEICTAAGVDQVLVENGRARGVRLASGEVIRAAQIVSSLDPRATFFNLVGAAELELRFVREVRNIRFEGQIARLHLALDALPRFLAAKEVASRHPSEFSGAHLIACPALDSLERASDVAKYGLLPDQPVLSLRLATALDPGLAPPGKHLAAVDILYVPYQLAQTGWDAARETLERTVIQQLESLAPGLHAQVLETRLLSPLDYEESYGLPNGDPYHGQMGLDQLLFMRPVPSAARYRTPIEGLYLCGAGSHPGGGVTGAPGYNAAREMIKDAGRK